MVNQSPPSSKPLPDGLLRLDYPFRFRRWGSLVTAVCMAIAGCGEALPERAAVYGRVAYRGEPVANGSISFLPQIGQPGPGAVATITDGVYRLEVSEGPPVGAYRVEIQGFRVTGREVANIVTADRSQIGKEMIGELMPYLPSRYGVDSTLTTDIVPGENELNYDLK